MGFAAEGEVWILQDAWFKFVTSFLPDDAGTACVALGDPELRDGELVVPFAMNTECHPSEQVVLPKFLQPSGVGASSQSATGR